MEFASIEETRIYYTRYAKNTGFSFRMGRVTKSRTNGPSKIRSVLCTKSGGVDNVRFSPQDVINYLTEKRQKKLENGDTQMMLSYFKSCQLKNPGFFSMLFKWTLKEDQQIVFGLIQGPKWHINTLRVFLVAKYLVRSNDGISPKTIITNQDAAISNAIAKVFPKVNHHYCMWYIEKKVPEYLTRVYHEHGEFKNQFYKCIHQSTTVEEFDSDWEAMIDKYGLQDNQWLNKIFSIQEKWIPAYVRHNFCAGMSTTQRSESMNKYFKDFLNSSTSLSQFVTQYEKALDARYNKEREKTFKTRNSKPLLRTIYPMEEETSKIYTRKMFRIFQDELVGSQLFITEKVKFSIEVLTYKVREIYKEKPIYYVNFHVTSKEASCSCHMFEYSEKVKEMTIEGFQEGSSNASDTSLFNSIMVHSLELSERGSQSEKHHDIAIQNMPKVSDVNIALHDPPLIATKGRPRTLRMKISLEMVRKGSSTCSNCMKKGHTKPKCPNLNQTR
ncbi:protein FAR1-RELATED SEQUENCE 5-like [Lathyrus oleraceus]|uniref:protein FAR1-RELATED SEQUENCE 5-like n=1 Tax=Pisum sativum TaxID=3888 RepID=UPI0021CFD71C|nr:protein FAR1-RELATED SEQUENCE 5-like [Pisum sativum]